MKRRLAIKSEYLSELSATELTAVAGGITGICPPTRGCLTGYYPSINAPCPTLDACINID